MAIKKSSGSGIPFGNNAGRPANPGTGQLYSNGEAARLELYTQASGWQNIVQETPGVSSITGSYVESTNSGTITISGTNFVSGCYATAIGTNGVQVDATSTTFNSLVQVVATFTGLSNAFEPYDIKVTNPSNLFGMLPDALYINANPAWTTSAGSLGTFADQVAISVSAVAADDSTITYAVASGSTLPSGLTLNSSTGLLSGTLADVASNTTYTFTLTASDGSNPAVSRQFSILVNAAPVWVTSSGTLGTFNEGASITLSALSATDSSDTVTYALASGSSLPSGVTLNSNSGVISGTLPDITIDTTYTFTINATDGLNTIPRTFNIISIATIEAEYLVIAGGGSGGSPGGGGGAGGYRYGTGLGLLRSSNYLVTVGNGANAVTNAQGNKGNNSVFGTISATGGGNGGNSSGAGAGGSGGGGSRDGAAAAGAGNQGSYNPVEGYSGGTTSPMPYGGAGGGGGAGGVGAAGVGGTAGSERGGAGGVGLSSSITGSLVFRAGGGGGGAEQPNSAGGGAGGNGGGGAGGIYQTTATSGTPNTGGGGGGAGYPGISSGAGGSGVVIIAYPDTLPAITTIPGTLTYDQPTRSGYRVYRFTAGSGTITV